MRIAICGLGHRATMVLSVMKKNMPEIEFVGYTDPTTQDTSKLSDKPIPAYDNVDDLLDATSPDLFFVASPNYMHLEHIQKGLESGVRVFAEKPVVTTIEDTFALAELLQKYGTDRVIIGLVLRYSQHVRDLSKALDAEQIGSIASIEASEYIAPYHGAFFMRDWRRKTEYSAGSCWKNAATILMFTTWLLALVLHVLRVLEVDVHSCRNMPLQKTLMTAFTTSKKAVGKA